MDNVKGQLAKDFQGLATGDESALQNLVDLHLFLLNKVRYFESVNDNLTAELRSLHAKQWDLERSMVLMSRDNLRLKQQLALTEDATRTLFLRIEGLYEKNGENLITYVASTLSRTGISCSHEDIDYVKRIGKSKQGSIRPVLVKFVSENKRNLILYNRANLNRNSNSLIWVNDDVSDYTRRQRKIVRDIAAYAKALGQTDLKVHGDGLVVGNGKYKHQDLDLLPSHLSIANAKQPSNDSDLYFQSEYSPLSNFYTCPIVDESSTTYICAEQLFQFKKAQFHEYHLTADKIMLTNDPYELKRLGNLVPPNQQWRDTEEDIMFDILRCKFSQNSNLAEILLNTGTLHLHEASADLKWSTGAELASKAIQTGTWPGADRMGSLLEKIREELRGVSTENHSDLDLTHPPPLESDDLTPLPDDDDVEQELPVPLSQPQPPTHTHSSDPPDTTPTTTPAHQQAPGTNTQLQLSQHSGTCPAPHTSPTSEVPPLMQQTAHRPTSTWHPPASNPYSARRSRPYSYRHQGRSPPLTTDPPSDPHFRVNTPFRANSSRAQKARTITSDRAPTRRSARLSQTVVHSPSSHSNN